MQRLSNLSCLSLSLGAFLTFAACATEESRKPEAAERSAENGASPTGKADSLDAVCEPIPERWAVQDVYFQLDPAHDFQNCYTSSLEEAEAKIKNHELGSLTYGRTEGNVIYADHYGIEYRFDQCLFDRQDDCTVACTVTLWDGEDSVTVPVTDPGSPRLRRMAQDKGLDTLDCERETAPAWRYTAMAEQSMPLYQFKLMQALAEQGKPLQLNGAVYTSYELTEEGNAHPVYPVRATAGIDFMQQRMSAEECDVPLMWLMMPDENGNLVRTGACPWGLNVAEIDCPGVGKITSPEFKHELPLDMSAPAIKEICGGDEPATFSYGADEDVAIPDDDRLGSSSVIEVDGDGEVVSLKVSASIEHSYQGDLTLTLEHVDENGTITRTVVLDEADGHSGRFGTKSYEPTEFNGVSQRGTWRLRVVDGARYDEGHIDSWRLEGVLTD